MNDYIKRFNNMKRFNPSEEELKRLESNINLVIPLLKYIIEHHNVTTTDGLKQVLPRIATGLTSVLSENAFIDSSLYERQALKELLKNPQSILKIASSIDDNYNTNVILTANSTRSSKLLVAKALQTLKLIENFSDQYGISRQHSVRDFKVSSEDPVEAKNAKQILKLAIELHKKDSLVDKLLLILEYDYKDNEAIIKENLKSSIHSFKNFFDAFGFLDAYLKQYSSNSIKFNFPMLEFKKSTECYTKNDIGLDELFSQEFLETLDIDELCYLNAFWCNRFAKECDKIYSAASTIDSLDLWDNILKSESIKISKDSLKKALQKSYFLSDLLSETCNLVQNRFTEQEVKVSKSSSTTEVKDCTAHYASINAQIGKEYESYFANNLSSKNLFMQNVLFAIPLINLRTYAYRKKDTTLEPLIKQALSSPYISNWGIIREELIDDKKIDSISNNRSKLLVGFDVKGFNFPFRFHFNKDSLIQLLKTSSGSCLIPEYQRADDFVIDGQVIPSNIIMPIPKRHKDIIRHYAANVGYNQGLWEHLCFLINGKFPNKPGTVNPTNSKNKKGKTNQTYKGSSNRPPVIYTDLLTGKRYLKDTENKGSFLLYNTDEGR